MDHIKYLEENRRHQEKFWNGEINLLFFGQSCAGYYGEKEPTDTLDPNSYMIDSYKVLSMDIIDKHAFDFGIDTSRKAQKAAAICSKQGDDWHPYLNVEWGTGYQAALFTNADVVFQHDTSYTKGPIIDDIRTFDFPDYNPDNRYTERLLKFWKGVEYANDSDHYGITPCMYRSPLDLANDMRGNDLFYDLIDYPDLVKRLVMYCAQNILKLDALLKNEIKLFSQLPGGVWGSVFNGPTMFLNGDPVDLVTHEMVNTYNKPSVEHITDTIENLYFHHHSIGHMKAKTVSETKGITVQEILQDPNGPKLIDIIDDQLIEASLATPIHFDVNLLEYDNYESIIEKLSHGRFIVSLVGDNGDADIFRKMKDKYLSY